MHGSTNTHTQNTHTCEKERPASLPARANTRKSGFIHSFIQSFVSLTVTYTSIAIGALLALFVSFPPRRSRIVCLASIPSNKLCSMYLEKTRKGVFIVRVCVCVCVCVVSVLRWSVHIKRSRLATPIINIWLAASSRFTYNTAVPTINPRRLSCAANARSWSPPLQLNTESSSSKEVYVCPFEPATTGVGFLHTGSVNWRPYW